MTLTIWIVILILDTISAALLAWWFATRPHKIAGRLDREGLMIVRRENMEAAIEALNEIDTATIKSGALNNPHNPKPKIIRKMDKNLTTVRLHLHHAQNV